MPHASRIPLPIDSFVEKVLAAFKETNRVVLTAPPGSGKTLRVPAALAQSLRSLGSRKKVIVLVPKRIAAVSAANRIAEENGWKIGQEVGYQVRFDQRLTEQTTLIFMTEGVFVKRMGQAAFMDAIDTIIFDEFHERSSLNDIAFGYSYEQQLLAEDPQNLKILVMSATLDAQKLLKFLENAKWIEVDLKPYPLQLIKSKKSQRLLFDFTLAEHIADVAKEAYRQQKKDILIFLPGLHEIRLTQNKISQILSGVPIEILHGSISLDDQRRILTPAAQRRIILSTNVAESSLTLPSVDTVIDSGLEKRAVYESKIGFQRLELKRISLFSARQRAGRAARVGPGVCYQLWHESDERSMSEQIEPEILRSSLFEEALILLSLGIRQPEQFSWLEQPAFSFRAVLYKFKNWGLLMPDGNLSDLGHDMQKCPLDLERALLFVQLCRVGFKTLAARLMAFLETADFSRTHLPPSLENLELNDLGRRIEAQLNQLSFPVKKEAIDDSFQTALIKIFFRYFPEKMAQKKEGLNALSSLGRGVQLAPGLSSEKDADYFLLLNGRDISDTTTLVDGAIAFSQKQFELLSQDSLTVETEYIVDFEKRSVYKQQRKVSGLFTLSTGTKRPLDPQKDQAAFQTLLQEQIQNFLDHHPGWMGYLKKLNFLKKKAPALGYEEGDFQFLNTLHDEVLTSLGATIPTIADFLDYDLFHLLIYLTPEKIQSDLKLLPSSLTIPSGKNLPIDYESERAPMISVRIQEALGLFKTPTLLNGRLPLTTELLAPNYRPAQITGDLENFWKNSYQDVRKDLRARYPKHDWPENPLEWKPEMSKRFKKNQT